MSEWFSIEVLNGPASAIAWIDAYGDELVTAAFGEGATDWQWQRYQWGVVLEIELADESAFERFRALPLVVAALDNVPDPVNGLIIHRGRGGSSGSRRPNRPLPLRGSGAAALPIPEDPDYLAEASDQVIAAAITGGRTPVHPLSRIA